MNFNPDTMRPNFPDACVVADERGSLPERDVFAAVQILFEDGAVATLCAEPRPILIGDLKWSEDGSLVLFTAYGDMPSDVHPVRFDHALVATIGSVTFLQGHDVVAVLHRIESADVDDTDDYRIAWGLWQQVAPIQRGLIERCYAAADRNGGFGSLAATLQR